MTEGNETSVISALSEWLNKFDEHKIRMRDQLNPGASEEEISALEAHIGQKLPDDIRELYKFANGQQSMYKVTYRMPEQPNIIELPLELAEDEFVGNLFGNYEFNSLETVMEEWNVWRDIRNQDSDADTEAEDEFSGAKEVRQKYSHAGWIPIANDGGGNSYAVDLDPLQDGTIGQIIMIGSDIDGREAIAPSITKFLRSALDSYIEDGYRDKQRYSFDLNV